MGLLQAASWYKTVKIQGLPGHFLKWKIDWKLRIFFFEVLLFHLWWLLGCFAFPKDFSEPKIEQTKFFLSCFNLKYVDISYISRQKLWIFRKKIVFIFCIKVHVSLKFKIMANFFLMAIYKTKKYSNIFNLRFWVTVTSSFK